MIFIERGKIELHDPVAKHLPGFGKNGKQAVTVYQLLTHQGGLFPDNPLRDYEDGREEAMRRIYALEPSYEPGKKFVYSDVGFIVLGEIVRRVSGQDVNEFSRQNIFAPLEMNETGYLPESGLRARAAPTEQRGGEWIQGEVHDPRSYELGGVAGHAGLFSTTEDLCRYAQMMLDEGSYAGVRILSPESFATMTKAYAVPRGKRGLGWDIKTGYSSNRGATFSPRAFGHGGFTGTSIWIDPELALFVIFLSNRVHPDGRGSVNALAGRIGTITADAISEKRLGTKGANSK